MTLTSELYQILSADPVVAAIVSGRVYPLRRPQRTELPAVTMRMTSRTREAAFVSGSTDLASSLVTFDCYGSTAAVAEGLGNAVHKALTEAPDNGVFHGAIHSGTLDLADELGAGGDEAAFRRVVSVEVLHTGD